MTGPTVEHADDTGGPVVATVGDLTQDHIGWLIQVAEPSTPPGHLPGPPHRTYVLGGIRQWEWQGHDNVGLLDTSDARGAIRGTERRYDPATPCVLVRQVKKPRRPAKGVAS